MYFLLNLSHYVKSYGHLCQVLAFFTMPALQVWPRHVTQEANFEKILFCPNSAFNPIPHGGRGADSALFQIVFFIISVRDAAEPRNLVTFPNI